MVGKRLWELNMRVELVDPGYSMPAYQFTWIIRDAVGGQVSNQCHLTAEALDYCILSPDFLLSHANHQFTKFYEEKGKGFAEILNESLANMHRSTRMQLDPILDDANNPKETDR